MTRPTDPAPACDAHRALVDRVLADVATDDELERYAEEVPTCAACGLALSRAVGVHPAVLRSGGLSSVDEGAERVVRSLAGPEPWVRRLYDAVRTPVPLKGIAAAWAVGALVAAAVFAAILLQPVAPAARPSPDAPVAVTPPQLPPARAPLPATAPPAAPIDAPTPEVAAVPTPRAPAPAPTRDDDAVADALPDVVDAGPASWPPPPYVDLRGGTPKSGQPVDAVRLQVLGDPRAHGSVGFAVIVGVPTELAVCVEGPERGVVWRGAVPSGRTVLTRDGLAQQFAFDEAGSWRFVASTTDLERCDAPVHTVPVEVR